MACRDAPAPRLCVLTLHGPKGEDVAGLTRSDITSEGLHIIQKKTGVELTLPILPELELAMRAYPSNGLALIGREDGRPFSERGLSQLIRAAVKAAGLPAKCVAHGLRKAKMRRLAEDGASEKKRSRLGPVIRRCARSSDIPRRRTRRDWPRLPRTGRKPSLPNSGPID